MMNTTPLESARSYRQKGWMPIPVPYRSKNPGFEGWQTFSVEESDLPRHFGEAPQNVGVLLGEASGDLADVDLDCDEAVALAPKFLPPTRASFGRKTRPRSHWLYGCPIPRKVTFTDPVSGKRLVELLTNGQQAIFPGSAHKDTGELIAWHENGEPARVSEYDLTRGLRRLAAAALFARHWPDEGSRQDAALALAGGLGRAGWPKAEVTHFIEAVCSAAGDEETPSRVKAAGYTSRRLAAGESATGWPTLARLINRQVVDRALEWLEVGGDAPREQNDEDDARPSWPELNPAALYGLAGDFVRLVSPHSEADPAALLAQFMVAFGNIIGRSAHFVAEADKHYTNFFLVLVGATGAGRKGTSWGQVKLAFDGLDEGWQKVCQASGMSSGEGLLYNVRDAQTKKKPIMAGGENTGVNTVEVVDHGVSDKRLLVYEGKFASVLQAQGREGNTLSMVIRNLWDTGDARSMVKNNPIRTTGAHVSIVGHITGDELKSCLDGVDSFNGYANRILWFSVKRDKFLPRGGRLNLEDLAPLKRRLLRAMKFARQVEEMTIEEAAWELWDEAYIRLETGRTGLLGKVTQRAAPYVRRLACIYSLLDCSPVVRAEHLRAALAFWQYAEDSARYVFGGRTGDRIADDVLRALREAKDGGMTRTAISGLFGRNRSKEAIDNALKLLLESGLVRSSKPSAGAQGRPPVRWFANLQPYERNERNTSGANSFVSFVPHAGAQAEHSDRSESEEYMEREVFTV